MVGYQGHAAQGDALAGEGGLDDLVGVVEVQPAFGLQIGQFLFVQPALPGEPFIVFEAGVVVGFYQGKVRQISGFFDGAVAFKQPGAGDQRQLFAKQAGGVLGHGAGFGVAQHQIDVAGFQVDGAVCRFDADVDVRVVVLKSLQPRDQPLGGERGPG